MIRSNSLHCPIFQHFTIYQSTLQSKIDIYSLPVTAMSFLASRKQSLITALLPAELVSKEPAPGTACSPVGWLGQPLPAPRSFWGFISVTETKPGNCIEEKHLLFKQMLVKNNRPTFITISDDPIKSQNGFHSTFTQPLLSTSSTATWRIVSFPFGVHIPYTYSVFPWYGLITISFCSHY